ncbi:MAG: hypothetical protein IJ209_06225 [Bacteroidaceae bacterium]|nr:hypothetical protein [Bacteroidaceae bacterium]
MRLLIFNPENDLALASNDPHYTPPASALQMASDLERLPLRWAEADDIVLLREGPTREDPFHARPRGMRDPLRVPAVSKGEAFGARISEPPLTISSASVALTSRISDSHSNLVCLPWGWSPLLVRQLRGLGVPERALPSDEQMSAYRRFSSRETAVRLLSRLRAGWPEAFERGMLVGTSTWCTSEDEVLESVGAYCGRAMLKAPWSGSGRGVHPVRQLSQGEKTRTWIRRVLKSQGGVEVEPLYEKAQDLALEFWADGGRVRYEGLSLFETTAGGVYAGNLVATEDVKEARLASFIPAGVLEEVKEHLTSLLNDAHIPTWYCGPLGVDMMIVKTDPLSSSVIHHPYTLHPLVEINLRMTMGWVALRLARELSSDETGVFRISQQGGRYQALLSKGKRQE